MILNVSLRLTRAVRLLTHPFHVHRALQRLSLTSKEMRSLALQVYYGNAVMLKPLVKARKVEPEDYYRCVLACPNPTIGALVRRLELQLRVDDQFEFVPGLEIMNSRTNQWYILLRPNTGPPEKKLGTEWQLRFPNLNTFDLTVDIRQEHWDGNRGPEAPARCIEMHKTNSVMVSARGGQLGRETVISPRLKLEDVLKGAVVVLNPRYVSVKVDGFACDGFTWNERAVGVQCPHGCSEKVAAVIKDIFDMRKLTAQ